MAYSFDAVGNGAFTAVYNALSGVPHVVASPASVVPMVRFAAHRDPERWRSSYPGARGVNLQSKGIDGHAPVALDQA